MCMINQQSLIGKRSLLVIIRKYGDKNISNLKNSFNYLQCRRQFSEFFSGGSAILPLAMSGFSRISIELLEIQINEELIYKMNNSI